MSTSPLKSLIDNGILQGATSAMTVSFLKLEDNSWFTVSAMRWPVIERILSALPYSGVFK
jgi:hypothetical protein